MNLYEYSYCVALYVGFLRIELMEQLYSKVALFGITLLVEEGFYNVSVKPYCK